MKTALKTLFALVIVMLTQTSFAQLSKESLQIITRAAEQGNLIAQNNLGTLYEDGIDVPKDLTKAAHFYLLAAQQGHPIAQANLTTMYLAGRGVDKNIPEAFIWAQKSANQGLKIAQYLYSWHCEQGKPEMAADLNNAIDWYIKAADVGDITVTIPTLHNCPSL